MAFTQIDASKPAGTDKKKFGDDIIRELKQQTIDNLKEITNYPAATKPALRAAVWTTATRPTGDELVDRVTGYNTTLSCEEYYDLASKTWKTKGLPTWAVATRPSNPITGMFGFCSDLAVIERYSGSAWVRVSGGRRGDIKMWSGATTDIETGWVLADGATRAHPEGGTYTPPNLRDRFIVGAGSGYGVGATGGEVTHVISVNEMPSHRHRVRSRSGAAGDCQGMGTIAATGGLGGPGGSSAVGVYDTDITGNAIVENSGGNAAHENRPPYYALCYLYKL